MAGQLFRSQRHIPRSGLQLSLVILFLMAACGGGDRSAADASMARAEQAQPTGGGENDPCALVTAGEAEQVLAAPPEAERPSESNNDYLATCRYVAPRGQGVAVLAVSVSRQNGPAGFENAKRMEEAGFKIQPVAGVGANAFWVGDPLHTLYVLHDTVYLDIGGDLQLEQARALALQAVERLRY
jgi:hypothetical protein